MAGPNPIPDPAPPEPAPPTKKVLAAIQERLGELDNQNRAIIEIQIQILSAMLEWENYEGYELLNRGTYHGIKFD